MEDMASASSSAEKNILLRPCLSLANGCKPRGIMRNGKVRPCGIRDYPDYLPLGKNSKIAREFSSLLPNDKKTVREFPIHEYRKEKKGVRDFPDFMSKGMECEECGHEDIIAEKCNVETFNEKKKKKGIVSSNRDFVTTDKEKKECFSTNNRNEDFVLSDKENGVVQVSQADIALQKYEEDKAASYDDEVPQIAKCEIKQKEMKTVRSFPTVLKEKKEKKATRDFPDSFRKEADNIEKSDVDMVDKSNDNILHQRKEEQDSVSSDKKKDFILVSQSDMRSQKNEEDTVDAGDDETQRRGRGEIVQRKEKKATRDFPTVLKDKNEKRTPGDFSNSVIEVTNDVKQEEDVGKESKKEKITIRDLPENYILSSDEKNYARLESQPYSPSWEVEQEKKDDAEWTLVYGKRKIKQKEKKTMRDFPVLKDKQEKKATCDFPDSICKKADDLEQSEDDGKEYSIQDFPDTIHKKLDCIEQSDYTGKEDDKIEKSDGQILCLRNKEKDFISSDTKEKSILESQLNIPLHKLEQNKPDDGSEEPQKGGKLEIEEKKEKTIKEFPLVPNSNKEKMSWDFPDSASKEMDDVESSEAAESKDDLAEKSNSQISYQRKNRKKFVSLDKIIHESQPDIPLEKVEHEKNEDNIEGTQAVDEHEINSQKEIEIVATFERVKKAQRKSAIRDLPDVARSVPVLGKEILTKSCDRGRDESSPPGVPRVKEKTTKDSRNTVDSGKKKKPFKEPEFAEGNTKVSNPTPDARPSDEVKNVDSKNKTESDQEDAIPMSIKRKSKTLTPSNSGKKARLSSGKSMKPDLAADIGHPKKALIETLRLFDSVRRKVVQDEEKYVKQGRGCRSDLQTLSLVKDQGFVQTEKVIGSIPGLDIGDIFCFRTEASFARVHGPIQGGIEYLTAKDSEWDMPIAIGIVSNAGQDGEDNGEELIYSGQGGRSADNKQIADQKMERGNLAMDGSRKHKVPVRVIRGIKDANSPSGKVFVYDGLYSVVDTFIRKGLSGFDEFQFRLQRMPDQTELGSNLFKIAQEMKNQRPASCTNLTVQDLSEGKERQPICVENTVDDEKAPLAFEYVTEVRYPDGIEKLDSAVDCTCKGVCTPSSKCSCFSRNGDEFPYLNMGSLVREKDYIFECGNQCSCSTSCRNRVFPKIRLEVFKTQDRGWGVRPLEMIAAGSFVCEYTGKLVFGDEMIKTVGNKEFVLDLRRAPIKTPRWGNVPNIFPNRSPSDIMSDVGTPKLIIDANQSGNVARFINHSCSPNLLIQKVLSHHQHAKLPQIKLFAMDNIPPLRELTFDYGCPTNDEESIACLCGSFDCRGRL